MLELAEMIEANNPDWQIAASARCFNPDDWMRDLHMTVLAFFCALVWAWLAAGGPDMGVHKLTAHDAVEAGVLADEEIAAAQAELPEHVARTRSTPSAR